MDEGNVVALNAFTNWDTLRELTSRYNANSRISADLRVDETLADIRDAVAHERVSASTPSGQLKLLKFSKPERNEKYVKVIFSVTMTKEWFNLQIRRVHDAVLRVSKANEELQNSRL